MKKFPFDSLESLRKKLLDLSNRNTLLNYKHSKTSSIRLIDELPDQINEVLQAGKSFTFIPIPEPEEKKLIEEEFIQLNELGEQISAEEPSAEQWAKLLGIDTNYDLPESNNVTKNEQKHQDTSLQTLLFAPQLEARLRSIRNKAETAIHESGANILYLALGFLESYERGDSDVARYAPLFNLPVKLDRAKLNKKEGVYQYTITLKDDGILTNMTLREKLDHDFELGLPIVEDDTTPEKYFKKIENTIIKHNRRWRLRRQASLVLLNFTKQTLYKDLDPKNWPEGKKLENHPLIRRFFGASDLEEDRESHYFPESHRIDSVPNIHDQFPLIYEADSSQHRALINAIGGKNMVIEGPPGTGKSQTITNLIASCLRNGKKVLFVAEKMAALNVVKNRLDQAGLGDFCLELHSHKTNKQKILQDLEQRRNSQEKYTSPESLESDIDRFEDLRETLEKYAIKINKEWKQTGKTLHVILNKATRLREKFNLNPKDMTIEDINGETFTILKQIELLDQADMLVHVFNQVSEQAIEGKISNHFWYGVQKKDIDSIQENELVHSLESWNLDLIDLNQSWNQAIEQFQLEENGNVCLTNIQNFVDTLSQLPELRGGEPLKDLEGIIKRQACFDNLLEKYGQIHSDIQPVSQVIRAECIGKSSTTDSLEHILQNCKSMGLNFDSSFYNIQEDRDKITQLNKQINAFSKILSDIKLHASNELSIAFEPSINGLHEFLKLSNLIESLPSDLWRYRKNLFDDPDLDNLITSGASLNH